MLSISIDSTGATLKRGGYAAGACGCCDCGRQTISCGLSLAV